MSRWHLWTSTEKLPAALVLRLAEPEGCVRLFADLGLPMVCLLQVTCERGLLPGYVATLLAAFDAGVLAFNLIGDGLRDALDPRQKG